MIVILIAHSRTSAQRTFHSIQEIWAYAEQHNTQIALAASQRQISTGAVQQSYGNLLPSATINGAFTDNITVQPTLIPAELFGGEPGAFVEETFGKRYNYSAGLSVQIDLINTSNWLGIRHAKYNKTITHLNWQKSQYDVYQRSAHAYFTYLLMREMETLASESLNTATEMASLAKKLHLQGQVSELTFNNATIQAKMASIALRSAKQDQVQALNQLRQLLDLSVMDSIQIEEEVINMEEMEAIDLNTSHALDVKLSYAELLSAKNSVDLSKAAYVPTLSAVYGFNSQVAGEAFLDFNNSNNLPQQYWGLRITIPLFSHQSRSFQVDKARIEFESKQRQYESKIKQISVEDKNLITSFNSARAAFLGSKDVLELYQKNDIHASNKLAAGQISLDDRLRFYQDYLNYKNEYLHHLSDLFIRYADLQLRSKTF